MYQDKTFIAMIPARSGSKRLPGKNTLSLCNKPLIAWSIEAGLNSKYIDEVMVTTDCSEIAGISEEFGANVPFLRPSELASDTATSFDVVKHAVDYYQLILKKEFDYVVLLQPTSPLRSNCDIDNAIEFLGEKNADAVISVGETRLNPLWINILPKNLSFEHFLNEGLTDKRKQNFDKYYRLNGAIYICKTDLLLKEKSFFIKKNIYAYVMDEEKSIDIDTKLEFEMASFLLKKMAKQ